MFSHSPHKDYVLAPPVRTSLAWLETPLITGLLLALCYWASPDDPLFINSFPWPILAPLLLGVRYGFFHGLISSMIIIGAVFWMRSRGLPVYAELPASYIIGMLVSSMVVGEFRDLWGRRLQRLQMANEYRQYRLDEFTRAYQVLRISHDRLEQRVAASEQSLRSSLLLLRNRARQLSEKGELLTPMAESILAVLAQYGSFNAAALYPVDSEGRLKGKPLAVMGEMDSLDSNDLLVQMCLEKGDVVSVRETIIEQGKDASLSSLQACVPLIDAEDRLLAVVAIKSMPFFAFNDRTFSLLALLGGHVADLLQSDPKALQLPSLDAQQFSQHLKRARLDAEHHDLPGSLMFVELSLENEPLLKALQDSQRGLDLQIQLRNGRSYAGVMILMPLTDAEGVLGYEKRLQYMLTERFGQGASLNSLEARVHHYQLDPKGRSTGLHDFLYIECGLNDQQMAI